MTDRTPGAADAWAGAVLVSTQAQGSWAWFGCRLAPEPALYAGGSPLVPGESASERRTRTADRERAWLAALWTPATRLEIRFTTPGRTGGDDLPPPLECVLLGQVWAPTEPQARAAAEAFAPQLALLPGHAAARPLDAHDLYTALHTRLDPRPDPGQAVLNGTLGLAELRKRVHWQRPLTRTEAGFDTGRYVAPLATGHPPWEPVWEELARQPCPTVLGVCLEPYALPDPLRAQLDLRARTYEILAAPGTPNPVFRQPVPGDPFAGRAAPALRDALHRYSGAAYLLRISLAAAGPVPRRLGAQLAEVLAAPDGSRPATVVPGPAEAATAWANIAGLQRTRLPLAHRQDVPVPPDPLDTVLEDLADPAEAAAAFRLPYELPGRRPLFAHLPAPPTPAPDPYPHPAPFADDPGRIDVFPDRPGA